MRHQAMQRIDESEENTDNGSSEERKLFVSVKNRGDKRKKMLPQVLLNVWRAQGSSQQYGYGFPPEGYGTRPELHPLSQTIPKLFSISDFVL